VIKTNQRGFAQPPNHISTTQAFHLVTTTTNEHHPYLEETNNKQNPHINLYQPLFLPIMPLPLQQLKGMPITLHLPCLPIEMPPLAPTLPFSSQQGIPIGQLPLHKKIPMFALALPLSS
jgi:hypothetical protein